MSDLKVTTDVPTEIKMTRTFDAPRRLVQRAMREPALLKRWLTNSHGALLEVEVDLRVGGKYRQHYRANKGFEFTFTGVYQEVSDDRIVMTQRFNDDPQEAVVTTTLTERDGKTSMELVMRFESQAVRDMVIATGMEHGATESYNNLADLVKTL